MSLRTRFAPSPTGYLHIGGVRTALFNWLLARQQGGQFILRIDDTDTERNRAEALQPILDGFRWLGITWDEGPEVGGPHAPYFQSQRQQTYVDAALRLLDTGHAYPCYRTKEELDSERKAAQAAKRDYVHRGEHRDAPAAKCRALYQDKPTTLRLKIPLGTRIVVDDMIRGLVEWQSDLIGDPVILRPDGRALYNFATVIDDLAYNITHVIRAAEHLTNTAPQLVVYQALGATPPRFAHIPVVNEPAPKPGVKYAEGQKPNKNKKLSKRDMKKFVTDEVRAKLRQIGWTDAQIDARDDLNPAAVAFYRELGYLPEGLVNYLARLGWSLDDTTEILSLPEMIQHFSLARVNTAPASFDPDKLLWVAGEYMKSTRLEARTESVMPYLLRAKLIQEPVDAVTREKVQQVVAALGDRIKVASDILTLAPFFFRDPVFDEDAVAKRVRKPGMLARLREFASDVLTTLAPFDAATLETALKTFCAARNEKPGDLNHALRVATSGVMVGPSLFDILAILGRKETLRRVAEACARCAA